MAKSDELKARIGLSGPLLERFQSAPPSIPDHEIVRRIGQGSYGEVWLARNAVGTWRAVKIVYRDHFKDARPYEREFIGIQKYEPISRSNEGLIDILQIGRNDTAGYFYYIMELADDATTERSDRVLESWSNGQTQTAQQSVPALRHPSTPTLQYSFPPLSYVPKTLACEIRTRGRLPLEECITLGIALNLALGHLHRHGLLHRDVKPSNIIFVSGVPKLADIGLVTDLAEAQSFVGTEGFIPPEGTNSPQADLYALGKVIYEAAMGKDRHEFPEPFTEGLGSDADSSALMELNAILLKACAPSPKHRYRTAEEMNADLALLHSGQSVRDKHALQRRLKIATTVAVAMVAAMVLGVVPYYLAIKEARLAKKEAAKSQQVAQLLKKMLHGVGPSVALGRDTKMLREILDKTAESISTDLKDQPGVEAELRNTLGQVYYELGVYEKAEVMFRGGLALRRKLLGTDHPEVAESLNNLALSLQDQGKLPEAETMLRKVLAMNRKLLGNTHPVYGRIAQQLRNGA
jgi:serine/threonine protein kinase